jgi:subtilase family serine protease
VARRLLLAAAGALTLTTAALAPVAQAATGPTTGSTTTHYSSRRVCSTPTKGQAACFALRRTDAAAATNTQRMADAMEAAGAARPAATAPSGYTPADIQAAYKLPAQNGGGRTVAIVDAYDDPTAEQDLAVYRSQFGLPACTTANGCFTKMNQNGSTTSFPVKNGGWAQEISLDLDMVSAACPTCQILLVEASSASFTNLATAVNRAAAEPRVVAISNSYGGTDSPDRSAYDHPGIAITTSSGDGGYGVEYPAASPHVTAVGGTSLKRASNTRGFTETAWSGAGSGCSAYNSRPGFQSATVTGCSRRAVADVSAVADPNTGVAVYDSTAYQGTSGWLQFGGTSASSPIIASVYALAGANYTNAYPYTHTSSLFDVTSGSNGTCSPSQLCTARPGWDGPTGLGTPNGVGAF